MRHLTQGERITAMEVQVAFFVSEYKNTNDRLMELNSKLDDLVAFRNRGIGAFWLASALFGTSLVGLATLLINWIRGS